MTFLKKLGQILAKAVGVATSVGPVVSPFLGAKSAIAGTIVNDLTAIGQVVVSAEALIQGDSKGTERLTSSAPLVANVVRTSELVSGHEIANEALFLEGCNDITSGTAKVLNSLKPDAAKQA